MKNKSISIVSNNFWTIYKFRFDIVMMLLDKGYHLYLIAGNDSYVSKFNHPQITKILIHYILSNKYPSFIYPSFFFYYYL